MKKIFIFLSFVMLLFLGGCSYKSSTLQIEPYKVNFLNFYKQKSTIYLGNIKDNRLNKNLIALVTNSEGDNLGYDTSNTDFIKWYKDALKKALKINGFSLVNSPKKDTEIVSIELNNLLVTFNKSELTKENLAGQITLKLIIKEKNQTITKTISEHIKKYNGITISSKDFKKEINILLSDSVKMIVKGIMNANF